MDEIILNAFLSELNKLSGSIIRVKHSRGSGLGSASPGGPRSHRPSGGFDVQMKAGFDPTEAAAESREWAEEAAMRRERPIRSVAQEMGGSPEDLTPQQLARIAKRLGGTKEPVSKKKEKK